jgi:protein-S-isoprenylcysteine O-methyltransferase Ste14
MCPLSEARNVPDTTRVNAPVLLVAGLVAGVVVELFLPLWPSIPWVVRIAGVIPFAVGFGLGVPAIRGMRTARTSPVPTRRPTALVTAGIYSHTRNPMYVGMVAMYIGLALVLSSVWGFIFLIPIVAGIDLVIIRNEEAIMSSLFGAGYAEYVSTVPRWL